MAAGSSNQSADAARRSTTTKSLPRPCILVKPSAEKERVITLVSIRRSAERKPAVAPEPEPGEPGEAEPPWEPPEPESSEPPPWEPPEPEPPEPPEPEPPESELWAPRSRRDPAAAEPAQQAWPAQACRQRPESGQRQVRQVAPRVRPESERRPRGPGSSSDRRVRLRGFRGPAHSAGGCPARPEWPPARS